MCSSIFPSTVSFRTLPIRGTHGFSSHPIGEDSVTWPCQLPGSLEYSTWHLKVLVTQSYPSICNPMEPARLLCPWNSPGKNCGAGSLPSPGDLPDPGMESRSPVLQAGSSPSEPPGKPAWPHAQLRIWGIYDFQRKKSCGRTTGNLCSVSSKQPLLYFPELVIICYHLSCLSVSFGTGSLL